MHDDGTRAPPHLRLDVLEMQVAHQEQALFDLNIVVTEQWQAINKLTRLVQRLQDELQALTPTREGPEPPPPHY